MRRHGLSSDAKQCIASFIAAAELGESKPWDCHDFFEAIGDFRRRFERLRQESVLIVEEIIETGGPLARLIAAGMCLYNHAQAAEFAAIHPALIRNAEEIVANALGETDDPNKVRMICTTIGNSRRVPPQAVPRLLALLQHESELVRASAAAALCVDDEFRPFGIGVLVSSLTSDDPNVLAISSSALLLQEVQRKQAIDALKKALSKARGEAQVAIVQLLHEAGPLVRDVLPTLSAVVRDKTLPGYVRGRAAAAIGNITRDKPGESQILKKALRSKNWEIVMGASDGLALNGCFDDEDVEALAAMLSAEEYRLRSAAAYGLKKFGARAAAAIPALIARIGAETDWESCESLVGAFGAIGPIAVDPLLDLLDVAQMHQIPLIVSGLTAIGPPAAEAIAQSMLNFPNATVRSVGTQILWTMGNKAAPAIPVLKKLLDEATNNESAFELMTAIAVCGPAAQAAADAVVRALVRWDDDVSESAAQILRVMGTPGLAALQAYRQTATGEALRRIDNALASIGPQTNEAYKRLENYQRDDLLKLFVLVGDVLEDRGATNWPTIAKEVRKQITFTRLDGRRFGTTDKSIAKAVQDLGEIVSNTEQKGVLTTHGNNKKGKLTPDGQKLLREARPYLEQKYGTNWPRLDAH